MRDSIRIIESETVSEPGFYRMSAEAYHRSPCPLPELSSSIANVLIEFSPCHAYSQHPKLGNFVPLVDDEAEETGEPGIGRGESSNIQDFGSACHKIALGFGADIAVVNPLDHVGPRGGIPKGWTNASIKEARAEARAAGRIPILKADHERARNVAETMQGVAERWLGVALNDCHREVVVAWEEAGFWRKSMIDVMTPDLVRIMDLKSTAMSTSPFSIRRFLYRQTLQIQNAFYLRALDAMDPDGAGRRKFAFLFGETSPPFVPSRPTRISEAGLEIGRQQVEIACRLWDGCLATNYWPAYGEDEDVAEPSPWLAKEWGERMEGDENLNPPPIPKNWRQQLEALYGKNPA